MQNISVSIFSSTSGCHPASSSFIFSGKILWIRKGRIYHSGRYHIIMSLRYFIFPFFPPPSIFLKLCLIGLSFLKEIMHYYCSIKGKKIIIPTTETIMIEYRKRLEISVNFSTGIFLHFKAPQKLINSGHMEKGSFSMSEGKLHSYF